MRGAYLGEILRNWRSLLAGCLGVGTGVAMANYTSNLFAPYLIEEFGWRREDYALVGTIGLILLVIMPLAGRLADRFGVRRIVAIGVASLPVSFLALSLMSGAILEYFALHGAQLVFGSLTTTTIYSRLIAERLDAARGLGLSIVMTGPPLVAAVATPLLSGLIEAEGWRAGYRALAVVSGLGGIVALMLMPRERAPKAAERTEAAAEERSTWAALRTLAGIPAFWLILGGVFLCNLPQVLASFTLNLLLRDAGVSAMSAAWMLSLFSMAVLTGRFGFGLLLDRATAHHVAAVAMALPALGFLGFLWPAPSEWLLAGCVLAVGLAQGAEGDIAAYLVARHVGLANYSFAFGLVMAALSAASSIGSLVLSGMLAATGAFTGFLVLAAVVTLAGAALFLASGRFGRA